MRRMQRRGTSWNIASSFASCSTPCRTTRPSVPSRFSSNYSAHVTSRPAERVSWRSVGTPDDRVDELSLTRLKDRDSEIRATALDTLVRRGKKDLGQRALGQALRDHELDEQPLNEKRRFFAAVAKLCGDSALDELAQQLTGKEDRWFTSKKDKELAEAVAHGIRMIGTDRAKDILQRCSQDGARFVRAACAKELGH